MSVQYGGFFTRWFGSDASKYEAIHKKDDDISEELATRWISAHPAIEDAHKLNSQMIHEYVTRLIQDLQNVPINPSNMTIIKSHLSTVSKPSERVRQLIFQKLSSLKCDKTIISDFKFKLALVHTQNM